MAAEPAYVPEAWNALIRSGVGITALVLVWFLPPVGALMVVCMLWYHTAQAKKAFRARMAAEGLQERPPIE